MGKYIKIFNTVLEYQAYASDISKFILPNVSLCEDENKLYINPFTGSKILCKYNVTDTNTSTTLFNAQNIFSSMIVDDVEQEVVTSYTFNTEGEHTVLFTLPEGVTSIDGATFQGCSALTSVIIGNSVTSIDGGAFNDCSGLTSIIIPNSVTSISFGVFKNCSKLTNIICNATTAPSINYDTFLDVKTLGTLTVPNGSTGYNVWMGTGDYYLGKYNWTLLEGNQVLCKYNVTDTSNPTTLRTSLAGDVFKSMEIDGVMLNEPVTEYTFDTVGEHIVKYELYDETKLDYNGLAYCDSLTSIVIPSSVTSIDEYTFNSCSGLTSIFIPSSVTNIGNGAFYRCNSLTSIVIPNSVTSIGEKTFNDCTGLTSIVIPNNVTSIGVSAFEGCSGLTSIVIPNSVTSIGDYAFYDCSSLISITIPDSVTSIGSSVFEGCSSLTSITVDSNNTVYDSRNNCNAIIETATNTLISGCKNTIIPDSVISIGDFAFSSCSGLTSIVIPSSVTSIGEAAFQNCSGLTSIVIPSGVTSIGDYAFNSCSLTSIVSNATTAPTAQIRTFQSVKTDGTLTVPVGSTGYDAWMSTNAHYLGYYNWTKVEQ